MKIINVVQDFNAGGIQKLLLEYLRYFKNEKDVDYRVVVLEKKYNSIYDKICEKEGLKITYLNAYLSKNSHYYIRKLANRWRYSHALYRYLKKEKPDVVHTHNTRIFIRIEPCIKKLCKKYKWFHTLHSDPFAVNDAHVPIAKRVFHDYHVQPVCLNETQFIKAKERYELNSCLYLPNAFDQNKLKENIIPADTFRKSLGIPEDHLLIGCVGRIDPVKNYSFFVDIMKEIIQINPKTTAIIAGDKTGAKDIEDKIKLYDLENNILLLGTRSDVQNIYNAIDRFVQTSTSEASSFVTIEAQLFNKYCIVSPAIPKESFCLNNKIVVLDLNEPTTIWAKNILKPERFIEPVKKLQDYSIANSAQKIISIYDAFNI